MPDKHVSEINKSISNFKPYFQYTLSRVFIEHNLLRKLINVYL